ncbi:hypothetical protein CAPTEDRAFT_186061 [Capitella teleta]|uniref:Uncharacterized protein n=1 Tax=Capitella teleta TaxID=283909 RepID=R7UE08_CAPTE|nr:hypothetical protein CAPTEDRAFT_186061 [Capitella teleta]|eukprot:ELU04774.1 hypothetical protein CAPTEDRAFT_186061 [Capitella teleta]
MSAEADTLHGSVGEQQKSTSQISDSTDHKILSDEGDTKSSTSATEDPEANQEDDVEGDEEEHISEGEAQEEEPGDSAGIVREEEETEGDEDLDKICQTSVWMLPYVIQMPDPAPIDEHFDPGSSLESIERSLRSYRFA